MILTSTSNDQIKYIIQLNEKSKFRRKTGQFIVEGIKMFSEIPPNDIVNVYISESFKRENEIWLFDYYKKNNMVPNYRLVSDSVFGKITDTVTPQGILAIVKQKQYDLTQIINNRNKEKSCIVVLDTIQDPGNLGTIVRTGEGAGVTAIVMNSATVDIYNPKVIRSTMGSIFRVPFVIVDNLSSAVEELRQAGIITYAAHLKGNLYSEGSLANDLAFLIGNEAKGLSSEMTAKADKLIKIPMAGKVESLNAAVSAAILMYEAGKGL